MIGQTLGHYRVLERIGQGGMGVVYRARDVRLNRNIALKVLPVGALADEAARKRFRNEALALARLNHPNIGVLHDFGTDGGIDFLVMEFIPGQTIAERLKLGSLPEKEAVALGTQIAAALEEAHEQGVVHLDLKPGNILVTPKGRAKVLDFGLAKLLRQEEPEPVETATLETLGNTGLVAGTLPYMPPESLRGERGDARSDIYAAGAVLYEMTTGQRVFPETLGPRLTDAILHQVPSAPSILNRRLSAALDSIILKALDKDPDRRYQSAKELRVDLERLGAPAAALPQTISTRRIRQFQAGGAALVLLFAALAGLNVGGLRDRLLGRRSTPGISSLAVLPLENLSRDPEQDYFADGMTEELITDMAKIGALRVISRTSSMHYKGTKKTLPEIARELNVDAIVEGSVLRSGDRVRITAELIQAVGDEQHLWAQSYDRDLHDVLSLQSDLARTIAAEIKVKISPKEQERLAVVRPVIPAAHEAYLKGRFFWGKLTPDGQTKAIDYFEQAVQKDPKNAPAYAGISDSYVLLAILSALPPKEACPKAERAAGKALAIDDTLADAHASLAFLKFYYDWDWNGAEKEFQRAIELNPGDAQVHQWYAIYLASMGQAELALAEIKRAQELDPLSIAISSTAGFILHWARRDDEAIVQLRRTLEMAPNHWLPHFWLGQVYVQRKHYPEGIAELRKARDLSKSDTLAVAALGHAYAVSGNKKEAMKTLEALQELSTRKYVSPYLIAVIYKGLGQKRQAFEWLGKAYEDRSVWMARLKVEPWLDSLRSDPRFADLLRKIGLSP